MAKLEDCLGYVLQNEGGYGEPPEDDQPTNFGVIAEDIAKYRNVPVATITVGDIRALTLMEATEIYRLQYWNPLRLDQVINQNIATCILDTGVQRGLGVGAIYAQRVCNLLGAALVVDGIIGSSTIAALNKCDQAKFIKAYENLEAAGYLAIISAHPMDLKYKHGWMARAARLLTLA